MTISRPASWRRSLVAVASLIGLAVAPGLDSWFGLEGASAVLAQTGTTGGGLAQGGLGMTRSVPTPAYFSNFVAFNNGDYKDALRGFQSLGRTGSIKTTTSRWIDSICYHTMCGECYYHMGQHALALEQYNNAVQLYLSFPDWMQRVDFGSPAIPVDTAPPKQLPWGRSTRAARLGRFRSTMSIAQGQLNANQQLRTGGPIQAPILFPVHVYEIVRCTTLAIRRRAELLGPSSPHDKLTGELVVALSRRPGPPNHWSEAWIDVQLGVANAAAGKDAQAKTSLERAVVAAGEFNHPLTSTALLELGRLALKGGDFAAAASAFEEAGYAAAQFLDNEYPDAGVLEESFRYGLLAHLMANRKGMFPPLVNDVAANWTRAKHLQASLLLLAAENYCVLDQSKSAAKKLSEARGIIGRESMIAGKIGARLNFIGALAAYQQGNVTGGDQALSAAMRFQNTGSLWMFHIAMAELYGKESSRIAMDLYGTVLRDPAPLDWATDPLESLSTLMIPHPPAYEHWFEAAMDRQEPEKALEITDLARRHRFLTTLDLGGRLHSLRWVLEGPRELLDQRAALERQDLLVHYPKYEQLAQQARRLSGELQRGGLAQAAKQQAAKLAQLADISAQQEVFLREMAVRREPCTILFPPRRSFKEMQAALGDGQALLSFFFTSRQSYAFLMTKEKYGFWKIPGGDALQKPVVKLLQSMGNADGNRPETLADLSAADWKTPGKQVADLLLKGANVDISRAFKELIVVPDGLTWHVPFEALPFADGDRTSPLLWKLPVRYAPTVALGVPDARPRKRDATTAVVLGKLSPGANEDLAGEAFEGLAKAVTGAVAVRGPLAANGAALASVCDRAIVLADIPAVESGGPYAWSPLQLDRTAASGALAAWFPLPWGGPDEIILPGFHTAAENSLKKHAASPVGNDVFLSVCGLMANGARTVLLSRWRTGGQTSIDLVREFAQELPHTAASNAWQRSVLLAAESPVNPTLEPRLKMGALEEPPRASHPFFWAGYLLVDTGTLPPGEADKLAERPK
jgi:hypothetical protein